MNIYTFYLSVKSPVKMFNDGLKGISMLSIDVYAETEDEARVLVRQPISVSDYNLDELEVNGTAFMAVKYEASKANR